MIRAASLSLPDPAADKMVMALGHAVRAVGDFTLLESLWRGGTAEVFRVRRRAPDPAGGTGGDHREYALKLLDASSDEVEAGPAALRRQAALLAAVDHPGLVSVHEVGECAGRSYLVMDLVDGRPLSVVLAAGPMAPDRVIALGRDLAGPLAAIHRRGLVHRDLKPDNVMVLPDGTPRLIDFGLAHRATATASTAAVGTFAYAAPEQTGMLRRVPDHRSDLYSLGVVLFECLAGHLPFAAADVAELLHLHAVAPVPDLTAIVPDLPAGLAAVVETLLAKDPDDRYDEAEQVLVDLGRLAWAGEGSGGARPEPFVPHRAAARWSGAARRHVALAGRTGELSRLRARWLAAGEGSGGVLHLSGPAGSGKSALAAELAALVEGGGGLVLHGRSSPDDQAPLAPLRAALADHLFRAERLPPLERARAEGRTVEAAGEDAALLAPLTAGLARVLGGAADPGAHVDAERYDLAVVGFLVRLAVAHGGLLLVLDDAQWLDPVAERVVARLAGEADGVPLLVLLVSRTAADDGDPVGGAAARLGPPDLVLGPLCDEAVAELVRSALPGADPGARLLELIVARSSGNPLVAHEYLRAIVDAGLLCPDWGTWTLDEDGLQALDLSQDAVGLLLARLRGLPPWTRDLLAGAAVVGTRFRPRTVAQVHGADEGDVVAALVGAADLGLLEGHREGLFGFVHEAVRGALLDGLGGERRRRLHLAAAAAHEAEPVRASGPPDETVFAVAHHYLAAGIEATAGPDLARRAVEALLRAGSLALDGHAPARAAEFLRVARALAPAALPAGDARGGPALDHLLGVALHRSEAFAEARQVLDEALDRAGEPLLRARILAETAQLRAGMGQLDAALDAVRLGLAELGEPLPRSAAWMRWTTRWLFLRGEVIHRTGWRLASARGAELERLCLVVRLYDVAGFAAMLNSDLALALRLSLRVTYWAYLIGSGRAYLTARSNVINRALAAGREATARRVFDALRDGPDWADPVQRALVLDDRAGGYFFLGRDDGQSLAETLVQEGRWLPAALFRDKCDALALYEAQAGRTGSAADWSRRAVARVESAGEAARTPIHRLTRAVVEAVRGRPVQAARLLQDAAADLPAPCPPGVLLVHRVAAVVLLREQDETGPPFDEAAQDLAALGLPPGSLLRMFRGVHYHLAAGRLAQARRASPAHRSRRLDQARAALQDLASYRADADMRALERAARADLLLQEGDPRAALRALAETDDGDRYDVPLAHYDAARVRARAMAALGVPGERDRQARIALAVAEEQGWSHRAGWVATEFGPATAGHGRTSTGPASATCTPEPVGGGWPKRSVAASRGDRADDAALQLQRQRLQALQQVSLAASRVVDPAELARISLDQTLRILGAGRAFLFLTDEAERLVPFLGRSAGGEDVTELTGYSASLVERVHVEGRPLVVTGTEEGAALGAQSVVVHGLRSIVIAPLHLEHRRLGVVYLDSQVAKGIFTSDDVDILTALTTHIATTLETARAAQLEISARTASRERDLAERLRDASQAMAAATSPEEVLASLAEHVAGMTDCDAAWVLTRAAGGARLLGPGAPQGVAVAADEALDRLLDAVGPVPSVPGSAPVALRSQLEGASWLALPLRSGQLRSGVLVLRDRGERGPAAAEPRTAFSSGEADVAGALVAQAATAYDRVALFAKVQLLAVVDDLTGIANRRHFFDLARRAVDTGVPPDRPLAALMIDIDHFKAVNDAYGHPTGDDVIRVVAQRLAAQLRPTDLLGRYGGEEFAVVVQDVADAAELGGRMRRAVRGEPVPTRSGPVPVTVSVGVAHWRRGEALEPLLARADEALYTAKEAGRDRVRDDLSGPSSRATGAGAAG